MSGAAGTLSNNIPQVWAGNFSFAGSNLNMGAGSVTLTTNVTLTTVSASTLTIGGAINGSNVWHRLTKAGVGTLALAGANTYTGLTTVAQGKLLVTGAGTLGSVLVGTNAVLEIKTNNVFADTAMLSLSTNWPTCYVILSNSVPDVIGSLIVGTNTYLLPGTYGSTNSTASTKIPVSFVGPGLLKIAAPTGTMILVR